MSQSFIGRDLISISDLTLSEINTILKVSKQFKTNPPNDLLKGMILANCFFEPSTRTRLSFESAMLRMGGQVIGFSDVKHTSIEKGESLSDSIKVVSAYADILSIRHPLEGSAMQAADVSPVPVINAGDGSNQHPTQTLLDLFTILETQKTLKNLNIVIVGDLKYGRTVHSLVMGLAHFNARMYFIAPDLLSLPSEVLNELKRKKIKFSFHKELPEIIQKADILYMTRMQKERFTFSQYQEIQKRCILKMPMLKGVKKSMKILHPLPKLDEIDPQIDQTEHAYYFTQAANGLFVRQAILSLFLGKKVL